MTESDLPYIKPDLENPPEANKVVPPSPDVKNPLPDHEPLQKEETTAFVCPICGKSFITKGNLDLHMKKEHGKTREA